MLDDLACSLAAIYGSGGAKRAHRKPGTRKTPVRSHNPTHTTGMPVPYATYYINYAGGAADAGAGVFIIML